MADTKRLQALRRRAYLRQDGKCWWCGKPMIFKPPTPGDTPQRLCTAEHLVPRSEGGRTDRNNIVAACRACNCARQATAYILTSPVDASRSTLGDVWPQPEKRNGQSTWTSPPDGGPSPRRSPQGTAAAAQ